MHPIAITGLAVGGIGIVCGSALAVAARFFGIDEDPRVEKAADLLPSVNCGGCGYAGCTEYAKAVVLEGAEVTLCTAGGSDVLHSLSALMGVEAEAGHKQVAIVLCCGDDEQARRRFEYNGIADCSAAHSLGGGDKACEYGCLGYASCANACPVGAIEITAGRIATVDADKCIGCSKCVRTCPRSLVKMIPADHTIHVLCSSKAKGPVVKKACSTGCIGCRICTKLAEDDAIVMDGFLAVVDYTKPLENEALIEKCPGHCIRKIETGA